MLALLHARTPEVPLVLLNAGADPTLTDAAGNGVLHFADQNGAFATAVCTHACAS
jgi:hypothetical protein